MGIIRGAFAVLAVLSVAGCMSSGGEGLSLGERIFLAGPTVPPAMADEDPDVYCPPVTVIPGGSVIAGGQAGDSGIVRSAIRLGQLARECVGRRDGTTVVKVGVEGRAISSTGGVGRSDVPVRVIVKSGGTVIANRVRRARLTTAPGDPQASFVLVEEGIVVPPSAASDFEIEVGLGAGRG